MKNQQGYVIQIVLVVFALIIGIMIFPIKFPTNSVQGPCFIGQAPDAIEELKDLPQVPDVVKEDEGEGGDPGLGVPGGGPDPDSKADYILIRKNVLLPKKSEIAGYEFLGPKTVDDKRHTVNLGEIPQKPGYDLHFPTWGGVTYTGGDFIFWDKKVIFFVKNDPSSVLSVTDDPENALYPADVYQDVRTYDSAFDYEKIFQCKSSSTTFVVSPFQYSSPDKKQLQLEWILFQNGGAWSVHCKPAVYLYPEKKQLVNVKVNPRGELSYTDPPYDSSKGWTVWAYSTGQLINYNLSPITHNYLYYESKILDSEIKRSLPADAGKKPTKGWVVKFGELEDLYNRVLPQLGLNQKEKSDFIEYWSKTLPQSPYYFVGVVDKNQRDYLEALQVIPAPDTSIRFSLYFEALDEPKEVVEPVIQIPERKGFTLVDWGGMVKLHPETPFTCSQ